MTAAEVVDVCLWPDEELENLLRFLQRPVGSCVPYKMICKMSDNMTARLTSRQSQDNQT